MSQNAVARSSARSMADRWARYFPVIFLLVYLVQCVWFIRTQSLTYDEPVHVAEGLDAWRHGRFEQYNDHPPLARLLCALPLTGPKWQVEVRQLANSFYVPRILPDPVSLAWHARAMMLPLGLLLGLLLWLAARQMFSPPAANFALFLFAFSPSLIAHFSLATSDGAATLLIFATAWQIVTWRRNPNWPRTTLLGLVLGLLLLAKFSTLLMFVLALIWMLVLLPEGIALSPARWNWSKTAAAMALALLIVWAGYFFHVAHLTVHDGNLIASFPNWNEPIQKTVRSPLNYSVYVPAGEYVEAFREVMRHNRHGQASFFLGNVSPTGGWKLYYPVTVLLKWPSVVLILLLATIVLAAARKLYLPRDWWVMASFPAVYFAMAIFARFNIGERHVLPVYPFALLFAAALWERARSKRPAIMLLSLLAVLNAADALRYAPGYLSYFNVLVPPSQSFRFLTDSNLDWGQGLLALRKYESEHPKQKIWLAYFGSVDPAMYGIRAQPLAENQVVSGTVIVSATNLSGQFLDDPKGYRWLLAYKPSEILDHSLYVFHPR